MTKIDIFSGFLGAGKTTLIKKLLQEAYAGEKLVLIENEFGEIGIDGGFMQDAGIEVTEKDKERLFDRYVEKFVADYGYDRAYVENEMRELIFDTMLYDKTMEYLTLNNTVIVPEKS